MLRITEAVMLIEGLNDDFYKKTDETEWIPFSIETDGLEYVINFLGFPIYSTARDTLDEDAKQTLRSFVLTEVEKMLNKVSKFNIKDWS